MNDDSYSVKCNVNINQTEHNSKTNDHNQVTKSTYDQLTNLYRVCSKSYICYKSTNQLANFCDHSIMHTTFWSI
ncbi:hypothetical protein RchiOBHm_Chr5g0046401 [Rosa chinensis]|uniref:Uncharacterized protein n=1 Tax=Rosa chinensis TaxID=74649 RepID=A0A2P6QE51_ROSCH|nr:hypothetical protein RchiOBHm_Chr5g0046401 [Rosa chinensis]